MIKFALVLVWGIGALFSASNSSPASPELLAFAMAAL